ncbi:ATP-binding cassette domain-containing protein [Streptomyces sp. NPDC060194]|uniref:ATP-binding cassette domain-containing protein n=1 Tax=Streptomyces sp. NPDC060194 TaxID=3347069 RepID=UPI00364868B1
MSAVPVTAEGFGLRGPRGWAFRDVGFGAPPGALVAVEGPSGSGRTCLLLALTGRMRPTEGRARVGEFELPRRSAAVRRISGLGPVPGVNDLEPALTVAEHLRERVHLEHRFGTSVRDLVARRRRPDPVAPALARAGLDLDALPKGPRTPVRDLDRLEVLRLSVALALIGRPRLLAVDDADQKLSDADRVLAWDLLRDVAAEETTVLAVCSEAPAGAVRVSTAAVAGTDGAEDGAERTGIDTNADADAGAGAKTDTATDTEGEAADALAETGRA